MNALVKLSGIEKQYFQLGFLVPRRFLMKDVRYFEFLYKQVQEIILCYVRFISFLAFIEIRLHCYLKRPS